MRAPLYSATDDELLSQAAIDDPQVLYRRLRQTMPLSRVADTGIHLVADWSLIEEALHREEDFSSNLSGVLFRGADGVPGCFELPESDAINVIATADEPDHGVHRELLQPRFLGGRIDAMEQRIRGWVRQELTPLLAAGGGEVIELAERVPSLVVAELLGLPTADSERFRLWAMMGGEMLAGEVSNEQLIFLYEESTAMAAYLGEHFDLALQQLDESPDAPLLHILAKGVQQGRIERQEAIGIAVVLFGAGGESTAALIGSALYALARNSVLADQLRKTPRQVARFVEEMVRLEPSFNFHYRVVRRPCSLGGFDLRPGDRLMLLWASANRDPERFEHPDELRLERPRSRQHMGFGRGPHFCIGAALARLEARVVVEELLASTTAIVPMEGTAARYARSIFVRRLESLQVRLHS